MVSAISSHYSRRHWYMCFTSVQNISLACLLCMFVKSSLFIYTTHAYLVQKQLGSGRRFLQWHLGLVQVCGTFSRMSLYSIIDWQSLTVTEKSCRSGTAKMHFWLRSSSSHQNRGHRVECCPGEKWLVLSSVLGLSDTITGLRTELCNRGC